MGRARIDSHLGNGLYAVSYWRDVERAKRRLLEIEEQRHSIYMELYGPDGALSRRDAALEEFDRQFQAFEVALDEWATCVREGCGRENELKARMIEVTRRKQDAGAKYAGELGVIARLRAIDLGLLAEVGQLQSLGTSKEYESMNLWCVDFPHRTSGPIAPGTIVGTTESYGAKGSEYGNSDLELPKPHINIMPSYQGRAIYDPERDNIQRPLGSMTTAEGLMNVLQFLYVANQNPAYAVGTLLFKDDETNTGDVELYGTTPTSRAPEGYETRLLVGVPIEYQNCNAKVFEIGDRVVVEFSGEKYESAKVIGFAEKPRKCDIIAAKYTADAPAFIEGKANQEIVAGQDAEEVRVIIPSLAHSFEGWSDGAPFRQVRRDTLVDQDIEANAIIVPSPEWPSEIRLAYRSNYSSGNPGLPSAQSQGWRAPGTYTSTDTGWSVTWSGVGSWNVPYELQYAPPTPGVVEWRFSDYALSPRPNSGLEWFQIKTTLPEYDEVVIPMADLGGDLNGPNGALTIGVENITIGPGSFMAIGDNAGNRQPFEVVASVGLGQRVYAGGSQNDVERYAIGTCSANWVSWSTFWSRFPNKHYTAPDYLEVECVTAPNIGKRRTYVYIGTNWEIYGPGEDPDMDYAMKRIYVPL